jgi:hypothetical protein
MTTSIKKPRYGVLDFVGSLVLFASGLAWLYRWQYLLPYKDKVYFFALLVIGAGLLYVYAQLSHAISAKPLRYIILPIIVFPFVVLLVQTGGFQLFAMVSSEKSWYLFSPFEVLYFFSALLTCAELLRIHVRKLSHTLTSYVIIVAEVFLIAACGLVVFIYSP